jgi:diguanylate cyclase (GGDEF)-like protein/PAS domain S-box-containing protein
MFIKDRNFAYVMVNEPFARAQGKTPEEMIGRTDYDLWPERLADEYRKNDLDVLTTGEPQLREAPWHDRTRGERVYLTWKLPLVDANGDVWGIGAISSDVTLQAEARTVLAAVRDEEAVRARTDALTGLPNRLDLTEFLTRGLEHQDVAVLFCDMNGFKEVNDVYGHAAGDEVLVETGRRLQSVIREGDRMGRWGGDEFVVILPGAGAEAAGDIAGRIRQAVAAPYLCEGDPRTLEVSIGVALAPKASDADEVLKRADKRMYAEKISSRRER